MRARSSAAEHYGDIVGVAGSNPAAPTICYLFEKKNRNKLLIKLYLFLLYYY